MRTFKEFISERFINAIQDEDLKQQYQDEVWDILQYSYRDIGGIRGSGFNSKEDMIKNIPFWKIITKNGETHGVVLYKDRGGRKVVQVGVKKDSVYGKQKVAEVMKMDQGRSYSELSKSALGTIMKLIPWDVLEALVHPFKEIKKEYPESISVKELKFKDLPNDAQETLTKYPMLMEYGYLREIGGGMVFKVMIGTKGLGIK